MNWRVIKLGGSLLDLADLAGRFRQWRVAQSPCPDVVVVGGGKAVDSVLAKQPELGLDEPALHWRCIEVMSTTARQFAEMVPEARLLHRFAELKSMKRPVTVDQCEVTPLVVFDVAEFLRDKEPAVTGHPLAEHRDVTSDSIAARLAVALAAEELVLLKSTLPATECTREQAALEGLVDGVFPKTSAGIARVRCVNLRGDGFPDRLLGVGLM